jgi:hypothetical protein
LMSTEFGGQHVGKLSLLHPPFPLAQHAAPSGAQAPIGAMEPGAQHVSPPPQMPPPASGPQQPGPAGRQERRPPLVCPGSRQQTSVGAQQALSHCRASGQGAHRLATPGPLLSQIKPAQHDWFPAQGCPRGRQAGALRLARRRERPLRFAAWRFRRGEAARAFLAIPSLGSQPRSALPMTRRSMPRRPMVGTQRTRARASNSSPSMSAPVTSHAGAPQRLRGKCE